jgi:hypothetical protein
MVMYFSRVVALRAGIKVESPALTVNRLCGSGLQAIASAAHEILAGNATNAVPAGTRQVRKSKNPTAAFFSLAASGLVPLEQWKVDCFRETRSAARIQDALLLRRCGSEDRIT